MLMLPCVAEEQIKLVASKARRPGECLLIVREWPSLFTFDLLCTAYASDLIVFLVSSEFPSFQRTTCKPVSIFFSKASFRQISNT